MKSINEQYVAQMSIFRGGFDLDAAEAVLDWPSETTATRVALLQELKERGVLRVELRSGRSRFEVERPAPFPRGRLWRRLARRHFEHYASKALDFIQHSGPGADWFTTNSDNLTAAVRRAHQLLLEGEAGGLVPAAGASPVEDGFLERLLQLLDVTVETGVIDPVNDGEDLLRDLRRMPGWGYRSAEFRQRVLAALARGSRRRGDLATASTLLEPDKESDAGDDIPEIVGERALLSLELGNFRQAEALSRQFNDALERDPQPSVLARGNRQLAIFFLRSERWSEARVALENALILEPGGAPTLAGLSWALAGLSDATSAAEIARQAFESAKRSHRPGDRAIALSAQANTLCDLYRLDEAKVAAKQALDLCEELSWLGRASHVAGLLAAISLDLGDRDAAGAFLDHALEYGHHNGGRCFDPSLAREMIRLEVLTGDFAAAESCARDYLALARELHSAEGENLAWSILGMVQSVAGSDEALSSFGNIGCNDGLPSTHSHDRAATIYSGHGDLVRYRSASASGDDDAAGAALAMIGKRLAWALTGTWNGTSAPNLRSGPVARNAMVRRAVSSLVHALPAELRRTLLLETLDPRGNALVIESGCQLMRPPGGKWQELKAHPAALLEMMVEAHGPIPRDALIESLWPGDAASYTSLCSRLYVHISTLRKAGLGNFLRRSDDGYALTLPGETIRLPAEDSEPDIMSMRV